MKNYTLMKWNSHGFFFYCYFIIVIIGIWCVDVQCVQIYTQIIHVSSIFHHFFFSTFIFKIVHSFCVFVFIWVWTRSYWLIDFIVSISIQNIKLFISRFWVLVTREKKKNHFFNVFRFFCSFFYILNFDWFNIRHWLTISLNTECCFVYFKYFPILRLILFFAWITCATSLFVFNETEFQWYQIRVFLCLSFSVLFFSWNYVLMCFIS